MDINQDLEQRVMAQLQDVKDPETGRPITKSKQVYGIDDVDGSIEVKIGLTSFAAPLKADFQKTVEEAVRRACPDQKITVSIAHHDRPAQAIGTVGLTAKAVIAVGSGKGGVGKSTSATCLAIALQRAGCKVGLLDADVYGPSIPHMTGVRGQVTKVDDKIGPLDFNGMPVISIGFMVPPDQAVIWRGPMLHSAVTTFVRDVAWGNLDYLIIDMPPGTGDVALSLSQLLPITGSVIVCTPQEVALIDAIKAVAMFEKVNIPIVGMIENMSSFICPDNGKRYEIFGRGGAKLYAEQAKLPFLGDIPINIQMRQRGDDGAMGANFDDPDVGPFLEKIAYQLSKHLAQKAAVAPAQAQLPVLG
ncbi:MAG: Mrp/NBP35 family ATP-binding protein [Mariniblastus sp.]|nr:Mrp/NBP35 family ATP-binding protein [Mariniblastus sp.]